MVLRISLYVTGKLRITQNKCYATESRFGFKAAARSTDSQHKDDFIPEYNA